MIALIGGLGAAALWASATLASSRSSRMIGSRVVLAWVMLIGALVSFPLALVSPSPAMIEPSTVGLVVLAGICYVVGLGLVYAALQIGKASIVAPITATEGALAAVIAVALGDPIGMFTGAMLAIIAIGVVLSSLERSTSDVPAIGSDIVADALDGPFSPMSATPPLAPGAARRSALLAAGAAFVFGVGLFSTGRAASLVPIAWIAFSARLVGLALITVPLALRGRFHLTRPAAPLLLIAGLAEVLGSLAFAWGSRESIAITAVLGSQFAAITAVVAFLLFGERLARVQLVGVVLVIGAISVLAWAQGLAA